MPKHPTTIRLDRQLYREAVREAEKAGLSFSGVVHLLLRAFAEGTVRVGVTQYPEKYLQALEKESASLNRLYKRGKAKGYDSSKELFNGILGT